MVKEDGVLYLAGPYSHDLPQVRQWRHDELSGCAGWFMRTGITVYSPISHTHAIALSNKDMPVDWAFWEKHDRKMLQMCDGLLVLLLCGWNTSIGVTAEIEIAKEMEMPIFWVRKNVSEWSRYMVKTGGPPDFVGYACGSE